MIEKKRTGRKHGLVDYYDRCAQEYHEVNYATRGSYWPVGHRNDSCEILGLMNLFVMSSLNEGIAMALLEALALARPVVASRVGGLPEVIEHGVSGLLVTPGREDQLAQSCISLMDHYDFAQSLGIAGRKRVEERFSARFMAEKVADVYRTLTSNGEDY